MNCGSTATRHTDDEVAIPGQGEDTYVFSPVSPMPVDGEVLGEEGADELGAPKSSTAHKARPEGDNAQGTGLAIGTSSADDVILVGAEGTTQAPQDETVDSTEMENLLDDPQTAHQPVPRE